LSMSVDQKHSPRLPCYVAQAGRSIPPGPSGRPP
jgi:hypothetical protein